MTFFAEEIFVSDVHKKPVLDQMGEEIGRLKDIIVSGREALPAVTSLVVASGKTTYLIPWGLINLFNKRVISVNTNRNSLKQYTLSTNEILLCRDILDKQIVDINGAKLVRVNDLELGDVKGHLCLVAADIGFRGILRRLGIEARGERLFSLFRYKLPKKLIGWHYLQTVEPKLTRLTLTVSRQKVARIHPADLAEFISEVPQKERTALFGSMDVETAAEALHELEPQVQVESSTTCPRNRPRISLSRCLLMRRLTYSAICPRPKHRNSSTSWRRKRRRTCRNSWNTRRTRRAAS